MLIPAQNRDAMKSCGYFQAGVQICRRIVSTYLGTLALSNPSFRLIIIQWTLHALFRCWFSQVSRTLTLHAWWKQAADLFRPTTRLLRQLSGSPCNPLTPNTRGPTS